jgi:hypothetical protein
VGHVKVKKKIITQLVYAIYFSSISMKRMTLINNKIFETHLSVNQNILVDTALYYSI